MNSWKLDVSRGVCWIPMPSCSHDLGPGWKSLIVWLVCFCQPNIDTSGFQKNWIWVVFAAVPKRGVPFVYFIDSKKVPFVTWDRSPGQARSIMLEILWKLLECTQQTNLRELLHFIVTLKYCRYGGNFGCQFAIEAKGRCLMMFPARHANLCGAQGTPWLGRLWVWPPPTYWIGRKSSWDQGGSSSNSTWLAFVLGLFFDWGWRTLHVIG